MRERCVDKQGGIALKPDEPVRSPVGLALSRPTVASFRNEIALSWDAIAFRWKAIVDSWESVGRSDAPDLSRDRASWSNGTGGRSWSRDQTARYVDHADDATVSARGARLVRPDRGSRLFLGQHPPYPLL